MEQFVSTKKRPIPFFSMFKQLFREDWEDPSGWLAAAFGAKTKKYLENIDQLDDREEKEAAVSAKSAMPEAKLNEGGGENFVDVSHEETQTKEG